MKRSSNQIIIFGELADHGGVVHIDLENGELTFEFETAVEMA